MIPELSNKIVKYLKKYWSPEEISGKLRNRRMIIGKDSLRSVSINLILKLKLFKQTMGLNFIRNLVTT